MNFKASLDLLPTPYLSEAAVFYFTVLWCLTQKSKISGLPKTGSPPPWLVSTLVSLWYCRSSDLILVGYLYFFYLNAPKFQHLLFFLARHEVFISSLVGVWRQNEGKRWASSNHWGKFILKTIGWLAIVGRCFIGLLSWFNLTYKHEPDSWVYKISPKPNDGNGLYWQPTQSQIFYC